MMYMRKEKELKSIKRIIIFFTLFFIVILSGYSYESSFNDDVIVIFLHGFQADPDLDPDDPEKAASEPEDIFRSVFDNKYAVNYDGKILDGKDADDNPDPGLP
jgi:hypothetical protein